MKDNPTIFIESAIHAREWIAPATASYFLNELLTSKDAEMKLLAKNYNWVFALVVNPDGYDYTHRKVSCSSKNSFETNWHTTLYFALRTECGEKIVNQVK